MESYEKGLVSIMTPIYKGNLDWFKQTIGSVLSQSYKDFEFVVIDDGSQSKELDNLLKIFCEFDDRIRVEKLGENKGIIPAFNLFHELARGEFVTILDSDDWILPWKFKLQVQCINKFKKNWSYTNGWNYFYNEDKFTYWDCPSYNHSFLVKQNMIPALSVMWRHDLYDKVGPYPGYLPGAQDYDMWIKFGEQGNPVFISDRCFINRWHDNNWTKKQVASGKIDEAYKVIYSDMEKRTGLSQNDYIVKWNTFINNRLPKQLVEIKQ